jgi:hypothetical protein
MAGHRQKSRGEAFGVAARPGRRIASENRRLVQGPVAVAEHIGLDSGRVGSVHNADSEVRFGREQGDVASLWARCLAGRGTAPTRRSRPP